MSKESIINSFINGATEGEFISGSYRCLYIEGDKLYSYGSHYVLAKRIGYADSLATGYQFIINISTENRGNSSATGKQRSLCRQMMGEYLELWDADTSEKRLHNLIIAKEEELTTKQEKHTKKKNKAGIQAINLQNDILYKEKEIGIITSFCSALYGNNAAKYMEELPKILKKMIA